MEHKKISGQKKGASRRREIRMQKQDHAIVVGKKQIGSISKRELFLMGIIAYWCEGAKQKEFNISQGVVFSNSDPMLIKLFIKWIKETCFIKENEIKYRLYIHKNGREKESLQYWATILNLPLSIFEKTSFKKHTIKTNRINVHDTYYGQLMITISKSTDFNRRIVGWVKGISDAI